jgi:diketogulonate reductase-like aldo/keto reductase
MEETIPRLGLGTYTDDVSETADAVATALELGYRHLDTAQSYDNEEEVGEGLARADVPREGVFVATKLSTSNLSYDDAVRTARESAQRLGVDTIDLLYVHWPIDTYDPDETLPALDDLYDDGVIDAVGLSNFTPPLLREALDRLDAPMLAHQVECHPMLSQSGLRRIARETDHWLVAYAPIARTRVAEVEVIREIATEHDATPAQVALAWLLSKERVAPIPKATGQHLRENRAARELSLSPSAIERIDGVEERRRLIDFESAPWN